MDRRMYDGCPSDELKAEIERENWAYARLMKRGFQATYFPIEQAWMAFEMKTRKPASGFHDSLQELATVVLK